MRRKSIFHLRCVRECSSGCKGGGKGDKRDLLAACNQFFVYDYGTWWGIIALSFELAQVLDFEIIAVLYFAFVLFWGRCPHRDCCRA